jgi:hypothetical protein
VKEAIFDIAWTVGPNDFKQHWPKFKAALKRRDWSEAAAQSRRDPSQIPLKRNQEIKNLIRQQLFFDEQENGSYSPVAESRIVD